MSLSRARGLRRGPSVVDAEWLRLQRLNLSFVLHTPSTDAAVAEMALASATQKPIRSFQPCDVIGGEELAQRAPEIILTAHIGIPTFLTDCVSRLETPLAVYAVDGAAAATTEVRFFGAPAKLVLPGRAAQRLVAATAVARPGNTSIELVSSRSYVWPDEKMAALRALERIILAHVDQWLPPRELWSAPAEKLLPEVLSRSV